MTDLVTPDDVAAALLRPLTDSEDTYIYTLIGQASALLRNAAPSIDDRLARYAADPTDPTGISQATVQAVLSGVIKRYLINPSGLASTSEAMGPYSTTTSYALRSEKETRGILQITSEDLAALFPNRKRLRAGTIRVRPALAPRPVGRYGPPVSAADAVAADITWSAESPLYPDGAA